jgi:cell shape-determining protein MreC
MDTAADLRNLVDELSKALEQEKNLAATYHDQLLETRDKYVRQNYTVENQKKALEQTRVTLERYEKENRALRELVGLWI